MRTPKLARVGVVLGLTALPFTTTMLSQTATAEDTPDQFLPCGEGELPILIVDLPPIGFGPEDGWDCVPFLDDDTDP